MRKNNEIIIEWKANTTRDIDRIGTHIDCNHENNI